MNVSGNSDGNSHDNYQQAISAEIEAGIARAVILRVPCRRLGYRVCLLGRGTEERGTEAQRCRVCS